MRKNYSLIILSLLFSLFIYLFYRTEKTIINEIAISLISFERFSAMRTALTSILELNEHLIYSLPGGLWVFCVTLSSKSFFLKIGKKKLNLLFVPLILSIGLELLQLIHVTNGRFDFWDIGFSVFFWTIAHYVGKHDFENQNLLKPFTVRSLICVLSYLIVYLAEVWE